MLKQVFTPNMQYD